MTEGDRFGHKSTCRIAVDMRFQRCFTDGAAQPCAHCKTSWPAMRLSRRLAVAIYRALADGTVGHHEALIGAVCARQRGCVRVAYDEARTPAFALGGQPGFRQTTDDVLHRRPGQAAITPGSTLNSSGFLSTLPGLLKKFRLSRVGRNKLYHPVKCQASERSGQFQLDALNYSLPRWLTEQRHRADSVKRGRPSPVPGDGVETST